MSFYAVKMNDLNIQMIALEQKEKNLNEDIQKLQNQLNDANSKFNQPTGEVVVSVSSPVAKAIHFELTFLIPNAGWSPFMM